MDQSKNRKFTKILDEIQGFGFDPVNTAQRKLFNQNGLKWSSRFCFIKLNLQRIIKKCFFALGDKLGKWPENARHDMGRLLCLGQFKAKKA